MEKLLVIKVGGNIIDSTSELEHFLNDFSVIKTKKILVHGGGKIATTVASRLGIESDYIDGRRITDKETLEVVTMVYAGLVNKNITATLQAKKCNAIGVTGADANLLCGIRRPVKEIDYGFVGDIDHTGVAVDTLNDLLQKELVPVFAPLIHNGNGQMLNTNADTIASVLAIALSPVYAVRLIYCFEKKGILENIQQEDSVISKLNKKKYAEMREEKKISEGILPKIENAFLAIDAGVQEIVIGHAHDLILNSGLTTAGTIIVKD